MQQQDNPYNGKDSIISTRDIVNHAIRVHLDDRVGERKDAGEVAKRARIHQRAGSGGDQLLREGLTSILGKPMFKIVVRAWELTLYGDNSFGSGLMESMQESKGKAGDCARRAAVFGALSSLSPTIIILCWHFDYGQDALAVRARRC
ncbi:hypothetical protein PENSPDRAFT_672053 [Peniophora sp. CONT]|nr:hypothetical protein PENSPDRAFT_672053 [Peniophora sp. CONT]